jgi:ECF transporter S component (folate family)
MFSLKENSFNFAYLFKNIKTRWYFYVIGICLIILVVASIFFVNKKGKRNNLSNTQKVVYTAILSTLCFVGNSITIPVSAVFQISFIALFGFISGYVLGAGLGFVAAFIGDFLCAIMLPTGPYSPIINVGTALWGYIPGVIFVVLKVNDNIKILISFALGFILNSFAVNTFGLSLMYSIPFDTLILTLPIKLAIVVINCFISFGVLSVLKRILPKDKFLIDYNDKNFKE